MVNNSRSNEQQLVYTLHLSKKEKNTYTSFVVNVFEDDSLENRVHYVRTRALLANKGVLSFHDDVMSHFIWLKDH